MTAFLLCIITFNFGRPTVKWKVLEQVFPVWIQLLFNGFSQIVLSVIGVLCCRMEAQERPARRWRLGNTFNRLGSSQWMTTAAIWHTNKLAVSMEGFTEYGKDRSGESRLIWDKLHEAPFNTLSRCPINVQIIQTRGKLNRLFCSRYPAVLQASLCNKTMTDGPIFHFRPSFFRVHYLSGY